MKRRGVASEAVERLNEHSLEDCLGRQRAIAIYIVDGWDAGIVLVSTEARQGVASKAGRSIRSI